MNSKVHRILMTADTVGGVWTYALELASGLTAQGVTVVLATMGALPTAQQQREAECISGLILEHSDYKLEWMQDAWSDVERAGDWLLGLAERYAVQRVHLNGYVHAALPWQVPTVSVAHSCVCSWWRAVKGEPAPAEWNVYRERVATGLHAADCVVAPTQAMLTALQHEYGTLAHTKVIPNGRNSVSFVPSAKEPFILAAGRLWDEAKNLHALQTVAGRLEWPVYVAGEPRHPEHGQSLNTQGVLPLGRLAPEELARWMGRAAIYALPARYEPFGLSVLEAAMAGCALVLGDIPTLREVWGDAACFVPPDDTDALHATLHRLSHDAAERARLSARAQQRACLYRPETMTARYLALYQQTLYQ